MESLLYLMARLLVACLQVLPLQTLARLGRLGGQIAYWLDGRHRRQALKNLFHCFGTQKTTPEIYALARENFRRIGEAYATAVKTSGLSPEEIGSRLEIVGLDKIQPYQRNNRPGNRLLALGHFANFELYTHLGFFLQFFEQVTTYRALPQPGLNRLMQSLRGRSGCKFFERRTEGAALKAAMSRPGILLGLLADQHARGGVRGPFLGRSCATSAAPALFALRYHCRINTAICYRTGLGRWRIEINDEILLEKNGVRRSKEEITRDINNHFETAIRRDPANWFWVHDRWRLSKPPSKLAPVPKQGEGSGIEPEDPDPSTSSVTK